MATNDNNNNNDKIMEESRLKILRSRRNSIRSALKYAEEIRNLRLSNGWVPDNEQVTDPITGELISSTTTTSSAGKAALSWTAFGVAAGAVALRLGGRAALVSAIGLDFAKDNPELKLQLDQILSYAHDMNTGLEVLAFVAAWMVVKVFCFDAGGIVLALSSGVLFGGVWQGALASATAATIASAACFFLAKLDTPVRNKALEIVEEYPSLRGIEKVVAQDGFKAILTLRLAPILPIPLGLYNYVYGVTNVPFWDFSAGIFLGSFKPYLLDSYLGYFGMSVVDGSVGDEVGYQDVILLLALGLSVLIGVFASQLAGETWESVVKEVELERKAKLETLALASDATGEPQDKVAAMMDILGVRNQLVDGIPLPEWLVDWQINWGMAEERMMELIHVEQKARVWNYTSAETLSAQSANADSSYSQRLSPALDPALQPNAPEVTEVGQGVDLGQSIVEGIVLTPALFSTFLKFADPLYSDAMDEKEEEDNVEQELRPTFAALAEQRLLQQLLRRNKPGDKNEIDMIMMTMMQDKGGRGTGSGSSSLLTTTKTSSPDWNEWSRESSSLWFDDRQGVSKQVAMLRTRAERRLNRLEGILEQQQQEDNKGGIKK